MKKLTFTDRCYIGAVIFEVIGLRLLFLILIILACSGCINVVDEDKGDIKTEEASLSPINVEQYDKILELHYPINVQYVKVKDMEFMVFSARYGESGVYVVNLTKEELEVKLLREELVNYEDE